MGCTNARVEFSVPASVLRILGQPEVSANVLHQLATAHVYIIIIILYIYTYLQFHEHTANSRMIYILGCC